MINCELVNRMRSGVSDFLAFTPRVHDHRRSQNFWWGWEFRTTRPTPPSHAAVVHTCEVVASSWGSVSAPAVNRVMDGAPERKKTVKKYM